MNTKLLKMQSVMTKLFLWTSPLALILLLTTNFPNLEKGVWIAFVAPILAIAFAVWLFSLMFVIIAAFVSSNYKEQILLDVVLRKERDEREAFISGQAAKKSILITLASSILILICTTGQYNKAETSGNSSVTIGHFRLSNEQAITSQAEDGSSIIHYPIPMSKTSLVLLIILIQMSSYHAILFFSLRKSKI